MIVRQGRKDLVDRLSIDMHERTAGADAQDLLLRQGPLPVRDVQSSSFRTNKQGKLSLVLTPPSGRCPTTPGVALSR